MREWDTPVREPWNAVIKQALRAVDMHTSAGLAGEGEWHKRRAQMLREYVAELKDYLVAQE